MLLLNLVINFFILLATAKLCALEIRRWRLILAALLGAFYAIAVLLPSLRFLSSPVMKLSLALLMTLIAFGRAKALLRPYIAFLAVSAAFGGAVFAVSMLTGTPTQNGFFIGASLKVIILTFAAAYFAFTLVFSRISRRRERETVPVSVHLSGKTASFTALRDTGNELFDPISNLPVMIVGADVSQMLLPADCLAALTQGAPELLQSLDAYPELKGRFRLVPYTAVGVNSGLLPVVRPEGISISGKEVKSLLVGLSPTKICSDGEYSAII